MNDLAARLTELSERGTHLGAEGLRQRVILDLAGVPARSPARNWGGAVVAAAVTIVLIAGPLIWFRGSAGSMAPSSPANLMATQPVNGTEDVVITSDGSLWHGFVDGLRRWDLQSGRVTVYTEADGLPNRDTHLLGVAPDDTLWAVSGGRLVRFDGTWTVESIPELEELTIWGSNVGALEVAPNGDVLVAVGRDRLIRYDGSDAIVIEGPEYVSSDPWAGSLAVAPDGTIWAVLESGSGVASFDGDQWIVYEEGDGVPWLASNIEVGGDGTVWVGTTSTWGPPDDPDSRRPAQGIGRFDGTSWKTFTTEDGLLGNSGSIIIAPDGTVWVLHSPIPDAYTQETGIDGPPAGLSRFDGATWESVDGVNDDGGGPGVIARDGTVWTVEPDSITGFRYGALTTYTMPEGTTAPKPPEEPDQALPSEHPAGGSGGGSGNVTVLVSGIEGANGWRVGGVVFIGPNRMYPDARAIGGFTAAIDSDSFATTQIVTAPSDDGDGEFPYVTSEPLGVAPGTYTIAVYVGNDLGPYSRWVPGCSDGVILYDRVETFEVSEGEAVDIEIEFDLQHQRNLCSH